MTGCKKVEAGESNGEAGQRENFARNTLGSARGGGMGMVIGITLGKCSGKKKEKKVSESPHKHFD